MVKKSKSKDPRQEQINIFETMAQGMQDKTPEEQAKRLDRIAFYSKQDQKVVDACKAEETGIPAPAWNEAAEKSFKEALDKIRNFFVSDEYNPIKEMLPGSKEWFFKVKATGITAREIITLGDFIDQLSGIMPLIQEEIEVYKKENGLQEITFSDFLRNYDPKTDTEIESIFSKVYKRAAAKAPDKIKPMFQQGTPETFYFANHPVVNEMGNRGRLNTPDPLFVPVMNVGKSDEVDVFYMVTTELERPEGRPLDPYGQVVFDMAFTHYMSGNKAMTSDTMYKTMHRAAPSDARKELIDSIVEQAQETFIALDFGKEAKNRTYHDREGNEISFNKWIRKGNLLNVVRNDIELNGMPVLGWEIADKQVLFEHCVYTRNYVTVPSWVMKAPIRKLDKNGKPTEEIISTSTTMDIARWHLAKRIQIMQSDLDRGRNKQNHSIKFTPVYNRCGIDPANRTETKRLRDFIKACLCEWKQGGFIKSFRWLTKGQKDYSVTIYLDKKNKPLENVTIPNLTEPTVKK